MQRIWIAETNNARKEIPFVAVAASDNTTEQNPSFTVNTDVTVRKPGGSFTAGAGTITGSNGTFFYIPSAGEIDTPGVLVIKIVKSTMLTVKLSVECVTDNPNLLQSNVLRRFTAQSWTQGTRKLRMDAGAPTTVNIYRKRKVRVTCDAANYVPEIRVILSNDASRDLVLDEDFIVQPTGVITAEITDETLNFLDAGPGTPYVAANHAMSQIATAGELGIAVRDTARASPAAGSVGEAINSIFAQPLWDLIKLKGSIEDAPATANSATGVTFQAGGKPTFDCAGLMLVIYKADGSYYQAKKIRSYSVATGRATIDAVSPFLLVSGNIPTGLSWFIAGFEDTFGMMGAFPTTLLAHLTALLADTTAIIGRLPTSLDASGNMKSGVLTVDPVATKAIRDKILSKLLGANFSILDLFAIWAAIGTSVATSHDTSSPVYRRPELNVGKTAVVDGGAFLTYSNATVDGNRGGASIDLAYLATLSDA